MPAKCATTTARLATCEHDFVIISHSAPQLCELERTMCFAHRQVFDLSQSTPSFMARLIAFLDKMLTLARHQSKLLSFDSFNRIFRTSPSLRLVSKHDIIHGLA